MVHKYTTVWMEPLLPLYDIQECIALSAKAIYSRQNKTNSTILVVNDKLTHASPKVTHVSTGSFSYFTYLFIF